MKQDSSLYDMIAHQAVELANRAADDNPDTDLWDISDGLLAGAVHYWLFSRQPCEDPMCSECDSVSSPDQRVAELLRMVEQLAQDSEYFHSTNDTQLGRA